MNASFSRRGSLFCLALGALWALSCGTGGGGGELTFSGDAVCGGSTCECPGSEGCQVDCPGACDLECQGSGACDLACGRNCQASCEGSGACKVTIGHEGMVNCPGSGGCVVTCQGDCFVDCPGSGLCMAYCAPESVCEITSCAANPVSCFSGNGVAVCNGDCPPE